MTDHRIRANALGVLSLGLSLAFWLLLFIGSLKGTHTKEHTLIGLKILFHVWSPVWVIGLVLALIASRLGSRRWIFAALFPVASFFISVALLASIPF